MGTFGFLIYAKGDEGVQTFTYFMVIPPHFYVIIYDFVGKKFRFIRRIHLIGVLRHT